jgi:D-arabinose 1-dehydrogenase-like Zn-dependent alcohol dehydrogenase
MISGVLNILPPPIALGHEIVGEVVEVGTSVRTVEVGDQVVLPMQVSWSVLGLSRPPHQ